MAKQKKQIPLIYATEIKELNKRFYSRFDENFLYNKAMALASIVEHEQRFKLQTAEYQDIDSTRINDKFFESLRTEIHFIEMHQFEGFFALLMAIFNKLPHWIYLTTYATGEIKNAVKLFIKGDAEALQELTGGKATTYSQFVSEAVYTRFHPPDSPKKDHWNENLDNVAWLIIRMAERYSAGISEYNAYKHGLRVVTGESLFQAGMQDKEGKPVGPFLHMASKDSLSYLTIQDEAFQILHNMATNETAPFMRAKEKKQEEGTVTKSILDDVEIEVVEEEDVRRVYEVTKHFNPKESMYYLQTMNRLFLLT